MFSNRVKILVTILLISSLLTEQLAAANTVNHCYAKKAVYVVNSKRQVVGKIKKGTSFCYLQYRSGWVQFKYYGKKRYASTRNLVLDNSLHSYVNNHPYRFSQQIKVTKRCEVLNSTGKKKLYISSKGEHFKIFGEYGQYFHVLVDGKEGLLKKTAGVPYYYVEVTAFNAVTGNSKRARVLNYAKQFIGNPYVWGGTSLTSGVDCSGYTMQIMKKFGVSLPHYSGAQAQCGKKVTRDQVRPGDLLFYVHGSRIGHVTLYAGNNRMYEAKGRQYGIVESPVDWSKVYCIRNVLD